MSRKVHVIRRLLGCGAGLVLLLGLHGGSITGTPALADGPIVGQPCGPEVPCLQLPQLHISWCGTCPSPQLVIDPRILIDPGPDVTMLNSTPAPVLVSDAAGRQIGDVQPGTAWRFRLPARGSYSLILTSPPVQAPGKAEVDYQ